MSRRPLEIRDVHEGRVNFATNGPFMWASVEDLDRARLRVHKHGDAWIGSNAVVEQDITSLHNAIRAGHVA